MFFIEIMCAAPNIPNAYIVSGWKQNYKFSSRVDYKCNPGFEPKQLLQITCDDKGEWTEIQQCTGMVELINILSLIYIELIYLFNLQSNYYMSVL